MLSNTELILKNNRALLRANLDKLVHISDALDVVGNQQLASRISGVASDIELLFEALETAVIEDSINRASFNQQEILRALVAPLG